MVVISLLIVVGSFFLTLSNEKYSTIAFIFIVSVWGAIAFCWFVVATLLLRERKRLLDKIDLMETYGMDANGYLRIESFEDADAPLNISGPQLGFGFLNPKEVCDG